MAGLMSSSVPLIICQAAMRGPLDVEALRSGAFDDEPDAEGVKSGWVGLGDLLDTGNFFLAGCDARFAGFSFRMDARRPSSAVVRLQLAEKIREEEARGNRLGSKRRRELKEAIVARLTSQAEFVPSLVDCVWDGDKGRLFVLASSDKLLERILGYFTASFAAQVARIEPDVELSDKFAAIQNNNGMQLPGWDVQSLGTALLRGLEDGNPKSISVQNSLEAVAEALKSDMTLLKLGMICTHQDLHQLEFIADTQMGITGLRLPKPEKGAEQEATFLINASLCADAADIMEALGEVQARENA